MPVLGLPLLLVGLAALPMVAGIYWLRTRYRRQDVSSLFLWQTVIEAQGGGRKKSRLQTPLVLLLELLVILLLVLAATAPRVLRAGQTASVIVVLDDSYSMLATDEKGESTQDRAIQAIREQLDALPRYRVRLITAGADPQVLGKVLSDWDEVERALEGWRCEAPGADIDGALALAGEIGGPSSRLLVLSDHAMPERLRPQSVDEGEADPDAASEGAVWGRLRWLAVGKTRDNVAVVNAVRSVGAAQGEVVLIELMNCGEAAALPTLTMSVGTEQAAYSSDPSTPVVGEQLEVIDQRKVELSPGQTKRIWLKPEQAAGRPVVVSLGEDALNSDNRVVLMPVESKPLGVALNLEDPDLDKAVRQAVEASGKAVLASSGAAVLFTDRPAEAAEAQGDAAWIVRFDRGDAAARTKEAQAFLGPFVIDYDHPLTAGLSLTGVVWSVAPREAGPPDSDSSARPVVAVGGDVLLSDRVLSGGRHQINWRMWAERSTVLQSSAFPVLVWNIIEWRRGELPGVSPVNSRPGVPVSIITRAAAGEVRIRRVPEDELESTADESDEDVLSVVDRRAVISTEQPGIYEIQAPDKRYRLAVNAGSQTESDLRAAGADEFGRWDNDISIEREYQGLGWVLGLVALLVLAMHAFWLSRGGLPSLTGDTETSGGGEQ